MAEIKNIAVIGSGTMGNGIAHVFALYGYNVTLVDVNEKALQQAKETILTNGRRQLDKGSITKEQLDRLENIAASTTLATGVIEADLVVEAATENEEVKLSIFKDLDNLCKPGTILASNTSSISITKIAAATRRAGLVIGMHFMNPVPVMKLVEVINGYCTLPETTKSIIALTGAIGKIPVEANDYPGFVANRILMPMINEAIICLHEGVAGAGQIDEVMKLGMAHPMGPLALADFIGLDVCLYIMDVLYTQLRNPKYAPCIRLVNMVAAGKLGRKSGEGFYKYNA